MQFISRDIVGRIRNEYPIGTRIELIKTNLEGTKYTSGDELFNDIFVDIEL